MREYFDAKSWMKENQESNDQANEWLEDTLSMMKQANKTIDDLTDDSQ